jgi:hypothetical protein
MHPFQLSLFYELQTFIQTSSFYRKHFALFKALELIRGTKPVSFMVMDLEKILSRSLYFLLYVWQSLVVRLQKFIVCSSNLHLIQNFSLRMPHPEIKKC